LIIASLECWNSGNIQEQSYEFQCELTFLTDVTDHLNQLNLRIGKNQNIANLFEYIIGKNWNYL